MAAVEAGGQLLASPEVGDEGMVGGQVVAAALGVLAHEAGEGGGDAGGHGVGLGVAVAILGLAQDVLAEGLVVVEVVSGGLHEVVEGVGVVLEDEAIDGDEGVGDVGPTEALDDDAVVARRLRRGRGRGRRSRG